MLLKDAFRQYVSELGTSLRLCWSLKKISNWCKFCIWSSLMFQCFFFFFFFFLVFYFLQNQRNENRFCRMCCFRHHHSLYFENTSILGIPSSTRETTEISYRMRTKPGQINTVYVLLQPLLSGHNYYNYSRVTRKRNLKYAVNNISIAHAQPSIGVRSPALCLKLLVVVWENNKDRVGLPKPSLLAYVISIVSHWLASFIDF